MIFLMTIFPILICFLLDLYSHLIMYALYQAVTQVNKRGYCHSEWTD